jgi:glutamate synthase (NADPH/NADH) large chain
VLDEAGNFTERCNLEMVELAPVEADDGASDQAVGADLTRFDETRLKRIIENHQRYTNSALAGRVLKNWETMRSKFIKVMPVDFKRVLDEQYAARAALDDVREVANG